MGSRRGTGSCRVLGSPSVEEELEDSYEEEEMRDWGSGAESIIVGRRSLTYYEKSVRLVLGPVCHISLNTYIYILSIRRIYSICTSTATLQRAIIAVNSRLHYR